jgi:hypothetical protein
VLAQGGIRGAVLVRRGWAVAACVLQPIQLADQGQQKTREKGRLRDRDRKGKRARYSRVKLSRGEREKEETDENREPYSLFNRIRMSLLCSASFALPCWRINMGTRR